VYGTALFSSTAEPLRLKPHSRYDGNLTFETKSPEELKLTLFSLRAIPAVLAATLVSACTVATSATSVPAQGAPAAQSEKETRTAAQQKLDSRLLYEIYRKRGQTDAKNVPPDSTRVLLDKNDRALVDIRAVVTPALIAKVKKSGATVVSSAAQYHSIIARVPLLQLERLAGDPAVRAITPAADATTVR
jgi:hypothetical protein